MVLIMEINDEFDISETFVDDEVIEAKEIDSDDLENEPEQIEANDFESLYSLWDRYFNKFNWNNPIYHKLLFHVLIGQVFKNIKISKAGVELDGRISILLVQDQGTGKNTPFKPFYEICSIINNNLVENGFGHLKCNKLDEFSDASTIGSIYNVTDENGTTRTRTSEGYFSKNKSDIILIREARNILNSYSRNSSIIQYINLALESIYSNNAIKKILIAGEIVCEPTLSIIMTTYPVADMNIEVINSGLIRRLLVYYNRINLKDKNDNLIKGFKNLHMNDKQTDDFEENGIKYEEAIAEYIYSIFHEHREDNLTFTISKEVVEELSKFTINYMSKSAYMYNDMGQTYSSIISSYMDYAIIIASHKALLSHRKEINGSDIRYSLEIIEVLIRNLAIFIDWIYKNNTNYYKAETYNNEVEFNKVVIGIISKRQAEGNPINSSELSKMLINLAKDGKFGFKGRDTVFRKLKSLIKAGTIVSTDGLLKTSL